MAKAPIKIAVETITHDEATRKNIPSAEHQSIMHEADKNPVRIAYERRNRDLDPQLVWRGKDEQDWSDLVVHAPPLYIQEKVHPKVLIDDLLKRTKKEKKVFIKYDATKEHPAQTELLDQDVVIGTIQEQEWSGLITPAAKSDYLSKVEDIGRAVRQARSRANDAEVDKNKKIGSAILSYIFE